MDQRHILAVNIGSSSIKCAYYRNNHRQWRASVRGIDLARPSIEIKKEGQALASEVEVEQAQAFPGLRRFIAQAMEGERADGRQLTIIYRVKFGGHDYRTRPIDQEVLSAIKRSEYLSSRHSRYTVMTIDAFAEEFPHADHLAGFDSHYFGGMRDPEPGAQFRSNIRRRYEILPSGHHGLACSAALLRLGQLGRTIARSNTLLYCQVGSGVSVTAIKDGQPLSNTMTLASSDGPIMHKRCGSIEPGIVLSLLHAGYPASNLWRLFNEQSGIFAASETEPDGELNAADILKLHAQTHVTDVYVRRIVLSLADHDLRFGPATDIVFSGGVANHSGAIVQRIIRQFEALRGFEPVVPSSSFGVDGPPWVSPSGRTFHCVSIDEQAILLQLANDWLDMPRHKRTFEVADGICICAGISTGKLTLAKDGEQPRSAQILVAAKLTPELAYRSRSAAALLVQHGELTDAGAAICREVHLPCLAGVNRQQFPAWAWDREVTVDCAAQELIAA
jgi:acetate kinase/phosphohistidine swiveling domain-containing protein